MTRKVRKHVLKLKIHNAMISITKFICYLSQTKLHVDCNMIKYAYLQPLTFNITGL